MPIPSIIDAIVLIQKAITTPTGEKDLADAFDEPPAQIVNFPTFVNIERSVSAVGNSGLRELNWVIDMMLLFAPSEQKYSVRSRRLWVQAVIDKFCTKLTLLGTVSAVYGMEMSYEPVLLGETEYVAATFTITANVTEAFAFDAQEA